MHRILLALPLLAACTEQPSGNFDFQDSWSGDLSAATYAVGASVDIVVFGPPQFDMNTTRARALERDEDAAVRITTDRAYPELGCVVAEGQAAIPGDGRVAIADRLSNLPLDWVQVQTATVDDLAILRGTADWGMGVRGATVDTTLTMLRDGVTTLGVSPTDAEGAVLAGRFALDVQGGSVPWEGSSTFSVEGRPATVVVEAADLSRSLIVEVVAADAVVALELERLPAGVGVDMDLLGGDVAVLTGRTADGAAVAGIPATWTVDGWEQGTGDAMMLWGQSTQACWNGLCATL